MRQKTRERNMKELQIKLLAAELVLAINFLHLKGLAYRNIKPENVLISEDGHIKLIDFSLSKKMVIEKEKTRSFIANLDY